MVKKERKLLIIKYMQDFLTRERVKVRHDVRMIQQFQDFHLFIQTTLHYFVCFLIATLT